MNKNKKVKLYAYSLLSIPIAAIPVISAISCSYFEPDTQPQVPSPPQKPPDSSPEDEILWDNKENIETAYDIALKKLEVIWNKNFASYAPNSENTFPKFETFKYLNFGINYKTSGMIQLLFEKFNKWYNDNNVDYVSTGYYNIVLYYQLAVWIFWLGLNYASLIFYETIEQKMANDEDYEILYKYLPAPSYNVPYAITLADGIATVQGDSLFSEILELVLNKFSFPSPIGVKFNSIWYYVQTIKFIIDKSKWLLTAPVPSGFTGQTTNNPSFYEFYKNEHLPEDEIKKQEREIKDRFENGYKVMNKIEVIFKIFKNL